MPPKLNFTDLTDSDLDTLSQVTEQDILDAYGRIVSTIRPQFTNLVVADEFVPIEIEDASDT